MRILNALCNHSVLEIASQRDSNKRKWISNLGNSAKRSFQVNNERLGAKVIYLNLKLLFSQLFSMICSTQKRFKIGIENNCKKASNSNSTISDRRAIMIQTYRTANATIWILGRSLHKKMRGKRCSAL